MTSSNTSKLIFVDPLVADYQSLIQGINPEGSQVILLDPTQDGVEQITTALQHYSGIESVHIVSHGESGNVQLGSTSLSSSTIDRYVSQLQSWSNSLTDNADILFYGCDVAAGEQGDRFIRQISELTGADIAASTDRTGSAAQGGDWDLEDTTGAIESSLAFNQQTLQNYDGVLTLLANEPFTGSDTIDHFWIYGHAGTSADPYLTARGAAAPAPGGLPGQSSALDTAGNGALRLTGATGNQAAFVIDNRSLPLSAGLSINFSFSSYGGSGADGLVFFLIDASANPTVAGGFGGSLGYAQNTTTSQAGLVGGYLGIGYDEYGNFSNPSEGRVGGPGARPDSIAIRGSQANAYKYLTGTNSLPGGIDNTGGDRTTSARRTQIDITPAGLLSVRIDLNNDGDFADANEAPILNFNVTSVNGALPATFQFGFAAGTGGSTNIHEVRQLNINTLTEPPATTDTSTTLAPNTTANLTGLSATDSDGSIVSYTIVTLPDPADGDLYIGNPAMGGTLITLGQTVTPAQINQVYFKAKTTFDGGSFTYNAVDNQGAIDPTPGVVTLVVDSTSPVVTVDFLTTSDGTPKLTGKVDDTTAVVKVTINSQTYTAVNNGNGTWTLPDNTIPTTLADGKYDVTAIATDPFGNIGTEATVKELIIDTVAPTILINPVAIDDIINASEDDSAVAITGTTSGAEDGQIVTVSLHGKTYTTTVTSNSWSLSVPAVDAQALNANETITAGVSDLAGNKAVQATRAITHDTLAPTVAITLSDTALIAGETSTVTFTFSEAPTGFDIADITAENDSISALTVTADPKIYTATFTPTSNVEDPTNLITVGTGYTDTAGNTGTAGTSANYTIDTLSPTVAITLSDTALVAGETSTVTFTFSEAPTGFDIADITAENGSISALTVTADPKIYTATFTPTSNVEDPTNLITVGTGYTDTAGNTGTAGTSANYTIDTLSPTVAITLSDTALVAGETSTVTFTFSEAPTGFDIADITAENGSISALAVTADPKVYTAIFTPTSNVEDPTNLITVGTGYTDTAGNTGTTGNSANYTIDTLSPTVAITLSDTALVAGETSTVTFTFSEAPTGFDASDITAENGIISALTVTADPKIYTATFTPTSNVEDPTNLITVGTGYTDTAGNTGTAGTSANYTINTLSPTVAITLSDTALVAGETSTVTFTFSEAPTGFDIADITAENGSISALAVTADPKVYTAIFTPTSNVEDPTNLITVGTGYTDTAGNTGTTGNSANYTIDTLSPTVAITLSDTALVAGETSTVTFTFSEAPTGFDASDITAENGIISALAVTADPKVYTATFTPVVNIEDPTNLITVGTGYTDTAGNPGTAGTSANYTIDTLSPTVAITLSDTALVAGETSTVTFTFSEAPTGFDASDITAENGIISALTVTADPKIYTATFTPTSNVEDPTNLITVGTGYADPSGNTGTTGNSANYTIDTLSPTVAITLSDTTLVAGETSTVTFTFSEAPTGFDIADITAENGIISALAVTADPKIYTATFTPTPNVEDPTNLITVGTGYADPSGNPGTTGNSANYTIDTLSPTVAITLSDTALVAGETSTVTFTFSEAPTGFDIADITAENGIISALAVTADPKVYTATFTPTVNIEDPTNLITVGTGYTDTAGNPGTTGNSANYTIDTLAPTVAITLSDTALVAGETSTVTFTFSEAPTGFDASDITAGNGTISALAVTADPKIYTATFTPAANIEDPTNLITVGTGYTDTAGNPGSTGNSANYTIDTLAPTVAITLSDTALIAGETSTVTFTFSEAPTGFDASDITAENGTISALAVTADPKVYTATFTPTSNVEDPTNLITVGTGYTDTAGNPGTTGNSANYTIDTLSPTISINPVATDDIINTVEASTPVAISGATTGIKDGQTLTVKLHGNTYTTTITGNAWTLNVPVADIANFGSSELITASISDLAGNPVVQATKTITVDTAPPVVTVNSLLTKDGTPQLTGGVDDPTAIVQVGVDGKIYKAVNNGDGNWTLADNTITSLLADGTYNITAIATDTAGNSGTDGTSNELTIDSTSPVITVNTLTTNDGTPTLTGTIDDPSATVKVTVNGKTYDATNNGDGTWTLLDNTIAPALTAGTYNVTATATDALDNMGTDSTSDELVITPATSNQPPVAQDITAVLVPGKATSIGELKAADVDGTVVSYTVSTLPDANQGTLYLGNPASGGTAVTSGQILTPAQVSQLVFQASPSFSSTSFRYTATDNSGDTDATPATVTLNANQAPTTADITNNPQISAGATTHLPSLSATDPDGTIASYTVLTLPDTQQGKLYLGDPASGGVLVTAGQILTPAQVEQLFFKATEQFQGASFTYTATDNLGTVDATPATLVLSSMMVRVPTSEGTDEETCSDKQGLALKGGLKKSVLNGSADRDRISGRRGNDVLHGGQSSDILLGGQGKDRLFGDGCNDVLLGNRGNDKLRGGAGRDRLLGGAGKDSLRGDEGDDLLNGNRGNDRLKGGQGNDRLKGGSGNDRLTGNSGNDTLRGGQGKDVLRGGSENDNLKGGRGNDQLRGGKNNDFLKAGQGRDRLWGGRGNDKLRGGINQDRLVGNQGRDTLDGGRGKDILIGSEGRDLLRGKQDRDRLLGGSGDDVLVGGLGKDSLNGGAGSDQFVYSRIDEGGDRITNFEVTKDVIDLSRIFAKSNYASSQPLKQFVKLTQAGSNTLIQLDSNGKAAGGFKSFITLENVAVSNLGADNWAI
jgi:hypothetical protein